MRQKRFFLLTAIVLLWCSACERTVEPVPALLGYDYYPLETGFYRIYLVERTDYASNGGTTQSTYYLKELIARTYLSEQQDTIFEIERYLSNQYPNGSWQIDSVWAAYRLPQHVVSVENNRPFVRLAFPLEQGRSWNMNVYNSLPERLARIDSFNVSRLVEGVQYSPALRVLEAADSNLVTKEYSYRYYGKDIGMIESYEENLRYKTDPPYTGQGVIDFGFIVHFKLVDYGKQAMDNQTRAAVP
ncbi:MAG: hypothetical protein KatS3mg033_0101 [Thermonema sp.]|jgi:hypothetical protein|uniref:hypothetical protein n=1 Tax=Thermonema sp. TaxID=2231181 RepID=UPI0021DBF1A3|nr:hypothetical protein [Thermonema sp.]GIV38301.1 MAG: hypothetical protein KatS3mg033_0101 [Thermonema sp.]